MKLSLSYRPVLLILFVIAGFMARAQEDASSKFIDSLKKPALLQDTSAAVKEEVADTAASYTAGSYDSTAEEMPIDTSVTSRLKKINADSIAIIKKDKGFYYQNWLDSLLRAEDAKLKVAAKPPKQLDLSFLDTFFTIFKILLWVLAGALLVFIIYKLFLGKTALFLKGRKNVDTTINIKEEAVTAGKYEDLVKTAEAAGNYRLAVRYLYLQSLYHLAEKGYVRPGTEKTNYQYAAELRKGRPAIAPKFANLTYKYEYIWYGEYSINTVMYHTLKQAFLEFNNETA